MLLAREVAHTTDVDGMLASMTPQQFDEWVAYYKIQADQQRQAYEDQQPKKPPALGTMRKLTGV